MKKFIASLMVVAGVALISAAPAMATKPEVNLTFPPSSESVHVKATICHWANGNLSEPSVSLSAVTTPQDVKHGSLTLTAAGSLASFTAHDTPGHEQDAIIDIYLKKGNDIVYLYQANTLCNPAPTTTTTVPPTTTTTVPPTTTTTEPPVVTTTTAPPVTTITAPPVVTEPPVQHNCVTPDGFPFTTDQPNCGAATPETPVVVTPAVETPTSLPHTGAASNALAMLGAGLGLMGLGFRMFGKRKTVLA